MKTGTEENFIGVNITDACKFLLVHQERFEPCAADSHQSLELGPGDGQGILPESSPAIVIQLLCIEKA
jgi:hypothetical protein